MPIRLNEEMLVYTTKIKNISVKQRIYIKGATLMKQKFVVGKLYEQTGTENLYLACSLGEIMKGIFLVDLKTGMSITNIYENSNELEKQTNSMNLDLTEVKF